MKLSVIVPVYNEERTVKKLLLKLLKIPVIGEIVVINDGSTDTTRQILMSIQHPKISVYHQKNKGKGHAVRSGLKHITGKYVLIQDADLEYDPHDIPKLLKPIQKNVSDVVYGSRFLHNKYKHSLLYRKFNEFLNWFVNTLYGSRLTDIETCYKLLPTHLMKSLKLRSEGFEIDPEITCKLLRRKIFITEVPISYVPRTIAEGKKITWLDAVKAILQVVIEK
jgi:glycosyltransferase involved in cell wall biosynthesis